MKIHTSIRFKILMALLSLALMSCGTGLTYTSDGGTPNIEASTLPNIETQLKAQADDYCMNVGSTTWSATLPEFTTNVTDIVYTLTVPDWLTFDSETRVVSLATGVVPSYTAAIEVIYSGYSAADPTVIASIGFDINDCDDDGIPDNGEFTFGEISVVDGNGFVLVTPATVDTYRPLSAAGDRGPTFLSPPNLLTPDTGLSATNALDGGDTDFDGDGVSNKLEYEAGTNMFIQTIDRSSLTQDSYANNVGPTTSITSGDCNNDGYLDVIAGTATTISAYPGNVNGTLNTAIDTNIWQATVHSVAYVNNDANLDIIVGERILGTVLWAVTVRYGDGTCAFPTSTAIATGLDTAPSSAVAADFNGDGYLDTAITMSIAGASFLQIYTRDAAGAYTLQSTYVPGTTPREIIRADFNSDNIPDLAVVSSGSSDISVLTGNGDASFTSQTYAAPAASLAITTADFDNDGILDIAATNNAGDLRVRWGTGDGSFSMATDFSLGAGTDTKAVDIDGDGDVDIVAARTIVPQVVTVGLNSLKTTGIVAFSTTNYAVGSAVSAVVATDISSSGELDVVAATSDASPIWVLK